MLNRKSKYGATKWIQTLNIRCNKIRRNSIKIRYKKSRIPNINSAVFPSLYRDQIPNTNRSASNKKMALTSCAFWQILDASFLSSNIPLKWKAFFVHYTPRRNVKCATLKNAQQKIKIRCNKMNPNIKNTMQQKYSATASKYATKKSPNSKH